VGRLASQAIAARLSGRYSLTVIRVPDGTQPDQLPDSDIRRLLADQNGALAEPAIPHSWLSE